jgi:hypothetical protein
VDFFNLPNSSSRTMALGSTRPLTEMSTRNLPGGEGQAARKADNFTALCEPIVYKMWELQHLTALWVSTARYRDTFYPILPLRKRTKRLSRNSRFPNRDSDVQSPSCGELPTSLDVNIIQ